MEFTGRLHTTQSDSRLDRRLALKKKVDLLLGIERGEMAQQLKAFAAAPAEDLGLVLTSQMVTHNFL